MLCYIKTLPHLVSVAQVNIVILLLRPKIQRRLRTQHLENGLLILLCDTYSLIFHDEYNLGVDSVIIDIDYHFASVVRVYNRVFYNIDRNLLQPVGISVNAFWQHPVLTRFVDVLEEGVLLQIFPVLGASDALSKILVLHRGS